MYVLAIPGGFVHELHFCPVSRTATCHKPDAPITSHPKHAKPSMCCSTIVHEDVSSKRCSLEQSYNPNSNPCSTSAPEAEEVLDAEKLKTLIGILAGQNRRKRGQRKARMGSGKNLTFNQLKDQFGYGLKEAAGRLGICPTTLKRACRRNGIDRWPCRQIAKLNKAIKSAGYSDDVSEKLLDSAVAGKLRADELIKNCTPPASTGGCLSLHQSVLL